MALLDTTLRTSEAAFAIASLTFASVESTHLKGRGEACVFVPPGAHARPLPLVILLHGAYGAFWHWALRAGAHEIGGEVMRAGGASPMVLVMPGDGGAAASTGYFAHADADYERWIIDDVPALAAAVSGLVQPDAPIFLAGYSMGGFGALRLGARHPARVAGIVAHAAVTHLDQLGGFLEPGSRAPVPRDARDVEVWSALVQAGARLPPLRFDCGREDPLLAPNRALAERLRAAGLPHEYEEHEGGHDFSYWRARLPGTLAFFSALSRRGARGE